MTEETIFLEALDKKNPTERIAYLDQVCAGDSFLRKRVEELIESHEDPNSLLDKPAFEPPPQSESRQTQTFALESAAKKLPTKEELANLGPARKPGLLGSLAHYDVMELAGRGGMGVVFMARDTKLQRTVAIKMLSPQLAAIGTARQRFVREAQAAAAIRDQHVVSIHAVDEEGPIPYLVMEFVGGVTLEEQIQAKGAFAVKEVLRIGMQAAEGLAAAHRQGLIHRDVKPANILLENHVQRVKITDFGLARAADSNLTQSGVIAGTPLYMSPEQARGDKVDHRTDLFSLGSVLYTLCTGCAAFGAANTMATLKRVCDDTPRLIREINRDVPDWLAAIVDKLMAKDAAARYQTAAEIAALLGDHLARLNYSGPTQPRLSAAPTGGISKPIVWAASALFCIGLASLLVWFMATGRPDPDKKENKLADTNKKDKVGDDLQSAKKPEPNEGTKIKPPPSDLRVLTVSQKPENGGKYRTINAALEVVEPGKIIRVLDDAVYEEQIKINRPKQYRGVTLESEPGKKPTLRLPRDKKALPPDSYCVGINRVEHFRLRGFRFGESNAGNQVWVTGDSSGVVLENLEFLGGKGESCVEIREVALSAEAAPITIQGCWMGDNTPTAVEIHGRRIEDPQTPVSTTNIIVRDNEILGSQFGVQLTGAPRRVMVVGNRFADCSSGITLIDFLPDTKTKPGYKGVPGAENVLIANNTMLRTQRPIRVWDEGNAGLACKNVRVQNNLVLDPLRTVDFFFFDHKRNVYDGKETPGDIKGLLKSWRFSHNWREIAPPPSDDPDAKFWIPAGFKDVLSRKIDAGSRKSGDPDFLRPAKDSPLATGGAGVDDPALPLPKYVGAVPPEGVTPWNWDWTWDALARKLLTVSKKPEDGGRFRTINNALEKVEPGMTIRVLDDAVYEEQIKINQPNQYRGVTLEAEPGKKPTLRLPGDKKGLPPHYYCVGINRVEHFRLRGFRFGESNVSNHVWVTGGSSGLVLENLEFLGWTDESCVGIMEVALSAEAAPITIQGCSMRDNSRMAVIIRGRRKEDPQTPVSTTNIIVRDNEILGPRFGVCLAGGPRRVMVVGNRFAGCSSGITFEDLLPDTKATPEHKGVPGAENVLIANNTMLRTLRPIRVWDEGNAGLACRNVRVQNNLVLDPLRKADFFFFNHTRMVFDVKETPGDIKGLLKSWRFSHNWREIAPPPSDDPDAKFWIPAGFKDVLSRKIDAGSRNPGDPDFLRPAKDSPLATGGTGVDDPALPLPKYVGAVPPEGVEAWNWDKTWESLKSSPK